MNPELLVTHSGDGCLKCEIKEAKRNNKYIHISMSKEDIGSLLQGKHLVLLFLNNGYECTGMINIQLSNAENDFLVSEEFNDYMTR